MKKLLAFVPAAVLVAIAACGPRKTVDSPIDVADTSDPTVAQGKKLYTANCAKCHGYADPALLPEDKWPETVKEMGAKAKLGDEDTKAVLSYILAAKRQGPTPPEPTAAPNVTPSVSAAPPPPMPSAGPSAAPSAAPSMAPSGAPAPGPSSVPSAAPAPSMSPSGGPTTPALPPTPGYVK